jgi:hypothetical protein
LNLITEFALPPAILSYDEVIPAKFVAVDAVGLVALLCGEAFAPLDILFVGYCLQVGGVYTVSVLAEVVNFLAFGDLAFVKTVRYAVCLFVSSLNAQASVPVFILTGGPGPAAVGLLGDFSQKSLQ